MGKLCRQKEHNWVTHTVGATNGAFNGKPFSWKCTKCKTLGMLQGKRKTKLLPITNEEFERQLIKKKELFEKNQAH
jgi:hypothetical protein